MLKGRVDTYALGDGQIVNWRRESDYEVPAAFGIRSTSAISRCGTYLLRFVDEPLTVIVLTNLETQDRHPRTMARMIAGTVRPEYQAPDTLTPRIDPDAELTRELQLMLADIGNRRPSALFRWDSRPSERLRRSSSRGAG